MLRARKILGFSYAPLFFAKNQYYPRRYVNASIGQKLGCPLGQAEERHGYQRTSDGIINYLQEDCSLMLVSG
ncbi:unnamed protein product [Cylicocyclus nassatus]|uniref:Uncharacterized protein n=1 Tax=Cylicocyclus nassatus TaxID=53992 RepID=A0AA36GQW7_CYLNA|nr:unnamed protein product [Cylicocyclus nassatus]